MDLKPNGRCPFPFSPAPSPRCGLSLQNRTSLALGPLWPLQSPKSRVHLIRKAKRSVRKRKKPGGRDRLSLSAGGRRTTQEGKAIDVQSLTSPNVGVSAEQELVMEGAGGRGGGGRLRCCSWKRAASWLHIMFILIVSTGLPSLMAGLSNDVVREACVTQEDLGCRFPIQMECWAV